MMLICCMAANVLIACSSASGNVSDSTIDEPTENEEQNQQDLPFGFCIPTLYQKVLQVWLY